MKQTFREKICKSAGKTKPNLQSPFIFTTIIQHDDPDQKKVASKDIQGSRGKKCNALEDKRERSLQGEWEKGSNRNEK
jgi:hypothetical protein